MIQRYKLPSLLLKVNVCVNRVMLSSITSFKYQSTVTSTTSNSVDNSTNNNSSSIEIQSRVQHIFDSFLTPLNERVIGPLPSRNSDTLTPLPFVLVMGNHSSGKSRLIIP